MKPYGLRHNDELEYSDLGATSRHRRISSLSRRSGKRVLKKHARNAAKRDLKERSNDEK